VNHLCLLLLCTALVALAQPAAAGALRVTIERAAIQTAEVDLTVGAKAPASPDSAGFW
jgi:hypothetical protein